MVQLKFLFYDIYNFFCRYPTPSNLGHLWNYGVGSIIFLVIQIISGFFLSMHYIANDEMAFFSVEFIMRSINLGWLLRYIHSNGASFFFICVYIHLFRNLYYLSYLKPRQNVWNIGILILLIMILTAFTGYVSPWGQMSFWAATVITNLASAIPVVGDQVVVWLWGGFSINTDTLNRFFSLHYLLPFVILILVFFHIVFLHEKGSSNKLNVTIKIDKLLFHPYFTIKDIFFIIIISLFFFCIIGFLPNYLGHPDNYIQANPLVTPSHIVPEWYFLPFYAILRSIPSKLGGVILLLFSIIILWVFPIFFSYKNNRLIKIIYTNNKNGFKVFTIISTIFKKNFFYSNFVIFSYWTFLLVCILLGVIGMKSIEFPYLVIGRALTFFYFFYFIIIISFYELKFKYFTFWSILNEIYEFNFFKKLNLKIRSID